MNLEDRWPPAAARLAAPTTCKPLYQMRQMVAFSVNVPATFPKDTDLVWTLKANGAR
jgi:hypothetical protein